MDNILKDYYSLDNYNNLEKAKVDSDYLNNLLDYNKNLIWFTIHKYIPNLEYLVNSNINKEDLIQVGMMSLIKAINCFDESKNIKFSTFAVLVIQREIKSFIFKNSGLIKVPREVRKIKTIINFIQDNLGVTPSLSKISSYFNIEEEKIKKIMQLDQNPLYLDNELDENNDSFIYSSSFIYNEDEENFFNSFLESMFKDLKNKLNNTEIKILKLKIEGYKQVDIAKKLNIKPLKVCRILKKAVYEARNYLADT
jgi:RNA polymerase sporulation-specific sigma factor